MNTQNRVKGLWTFHSYNEKTRQSLSEFLSSCLFFRALPLHRLSCLAGWTSLAWGIRVLVASSAFFRLVLFREPFLDRLDYNALAACSDFVVLIVCKNKSGVKVEFVHSFLESVYFSNVFISNEHLCSFIMNTKFTRVFFGFRC